MSFLAVHKFALAQTCKCVLYLIQQAKPKRKPPKSGDEPHGRPGVTARRENINAAGHSLFGSTGAVETAGGVSGGSAGLGRGGRARGAGERRGGPWRRAVKGNSGRAQRTNENIQLCHALSDWMADAPDLGDVATAHLCSIKLMHGERKFDAWDIYVIRRAARKRKAWLEAIGHGVDALVLQDQLDELERTRVARPAESRLWGVESRLLGGESRLWGVESRLVGAA